MLIPEDYTVKITVENESIIKLSMALLTVAIITIIIWAIARKKS